MRYHIISHVVFHGATEIYGPAHVLDRFLKDRKEKTNFLRLPLYSEGKYILETPQGKTEKEVGISSFLLKWIYDFYFNLAYIFKTRPSKEDIVVAIDPLNCLPFAISKPFLRYKLIYYTPDYADKRFGNPLLDSVYKAFDTFCLLLCDRNWCVSEAIVDKRKKQGFGSKARFLPNAPILDEPPRKQSSRFRKKLVYVGRMEENMKIWELLKSIELLKRDVKDVKLILIGGGGDFEKIKRYIKSKKLDEHIAYLGPLENREVIKNLKKSGIGFALYSGGNQWNPYGDSMKIREYHYFGLPVVTTEIPSNAREVKRGKTGEVLKFKTITPVEIAAATMKIYNNFDEYSENALKLTEKRMKDKILDKLLKDAEK